MNTFLIIIAAILILIIGFAAYSGFFSKVNITEKEVGPFMLIYEERTGDYKESGKAMDRIYDSLINDEGIETYKGFGLYYDNPKTTETENLRSDVGCILEETDYDAIDQLKEKFSIREYPATNAVVVEFPYRNTFSIFAGVMKVYPKLGTYRDLRGYKDVPVMEIYDIPAKRIIYIQEIIK